MFAAVSTVKVHISTVAMSHLLEARWPRWVLNLSTLGQRP